MLYQNYIGLDIHNDKCHIVALRASFRDVKMVSHTTFAFDKDLATSQKVKAMGEVLIDFIKKNSLADPELNISIPRERVLIRQVRLPLAAKENLRTTLGYEMQKYVPLAADEIYFDYSIVAEERQNQTIEVLLFVIKKNDLDDYLALPGLVGYALTGIQIQATAICGFLSAYPPDRSARRIGIIHTGEEYGDVHIFRNSTLEQTKHIDGQNGKRTPADGIADWLEATNGNRVQQGDPITWFYYHDTKDGHWLAQLKDKTGLDITLLETAAAQLPADHLLCAYGLAMQGARNLPSQINLLPVNLRRKPSRASYYTLLVLAVMTIVAGAGWGASSLIRNQMEMTRIDDELSKLKSQMIQVEQLASEATEMERRLQDLNMLKNRRISALTLLEDLSTRIPMDTWIEELWIKSDQIQIRGYTDSASELLAILEDSPLVKDVVFNSAITRDKNGKEKFRIGMAFQ